MLFLLSVIFFLEVYTLLYRLKSISVYIEISVDFCMSCVKRLIFSRVCLFRLNFLKGGIN